MQLTITDSAKQQMSTLLENNPNAQAVYLCILGGGCAGFQYKWDLILQDQEINPADTVYEIPGGKFVVDQMSSLYLYGTTVDWKSEMFASHFEIINPNATSACGCGESVSF